MRRYLVFIVLYLIISPLYAQKAKGRVVKNVAITFEVFDKNNTHLNTFTFAGEQKTRLTAESKNLTSFKCNGFGLFDEITVENKKYIQAFLDFKCDENNQMINSKIGRLLIPQDSYQSLNKKIYLHANYPDVVLKIKELSL